MQTGYKDKKGMNQACSAGCVTKYKSVERETRCYMWNSSYKSSHISSCNIYGLGQMCKEVPIAKCGWNPRQRETQEDVGCSEDQSQNDPQWNE